MTSCSENTPDTGGDVSELVTTAASKTDAEVSESETMETTFSQEADVTKEPVIPSVEEYNFSAVVFVRINPEFRLYLDEEMCIMDVECLNADAESVCAEISLDGLPFADGIEEIFEESYQQGFLGNNEEAEITVERIVDESRVEEVQENLEVARVSAQNVVDEYEVDVTLLTAVVNPDNPNSEPETDNPDTQPETDIQVACHTCDGSGQILCPVCNGEGECTCVICAGSGIVTCARCEGTGGTVCDLCGGSGYDPETCAACNGTGNCAYCQGTGIQAVTAGPEEGETWYDTGVIVGYDTCVYCGGTGKCIQCGGNCHFTCHRCGDPNSQDRTAPGSGILTCQDCNGEGTLVCRECEGNGKVMCECGGSGYIPCPECNPVE